MKNKRLIDFYHGQFQPRTIGELIEILADASRRQTHGTRDNDVWENGVLIKDNSERRKAKIQDGDLNCHCRYISTTIVDLFEDVEIEARLTEWIARSGNSGDIRHTTSEIYFDGQYIHADVDMAVMFMLDGYLSSLELKMNFDKDRIDRTSVSKLCGKKVVDDNLLSAQYVRSLLSDEGALLAWYARMTDALLISTNIYTGDNSKRYRELISQNVIDSKRNNIQFLPLEEFRKQHYHHCL